MSRAVVIAIDGPAAAGKGTLARGVAGAYGFAFLDTGSLYRGVAWLVLDAGGDPADAERAAETARRFDVSQIEGADIRTEPVGKAASVVAANPDVRAALLDYQRAFAAEPPDGKAGAVLDGRDIGTVVCPDADVKLFVTASAEVRAERRFRELSPADPGLTREAVLEDIRARDDRDMNRADAPLRPADDAHLLDTSDLTIEAAFAEARRVIDRALAADGAGAS